jgi:hypothetical protein
MKFKTPALAGCSFRSAPFAAALCALAVLFAALPARAQKVDDALVHATGFILGQQDADGAIWEKEQRDHMRNQTAMSSLSILALAAMGHQPGDETPEGQAMRKALAYVLRADGQDSDGYLGGKDGSRMYGHGISTLMLSEMLGMGADLKQDDLIRQKCRKAIDLILRAQKVPKSEANRGGWRYQPDSGDSDMSVTVWQTMALRAAKNAGIDVPRESIDDAVRYIKRAYDPEGDRRAGNAIAGGFGYMGRGRELSTTAEGLLALQVCGEYEAEEVKGAAEHLARAGGIKQSERWFFYLTYYYATGMYQRGGKYADDAAKSVSSALLPLQGRDGSWEGVAGEERQGGKIYATCLAVLSLAVKDHFLPIYQR